jgi:3-deoxy-D-manno-octulosonic-acid transferase
MQAFKRNGRTNGIVCKQFQSSCIQGEKNHKCNALHQKKILKNGALLIVLNNDETEDATSLSEEDKDKMLVVTKRDIKELKDRQKMY